MTVMPRVTDGSVLSADTLNFAFAELEAQGRQCRVRRSAPLNVNSSTQTAISWQVEDLDTNGGGMWNPAEPSYITIQVSGTYLILGQVRWDDPGTSAYKIGLRNAFVTVNSTNPNTTACKGNQSTDATKSLTGRGSTTQTYAVEPLNAGDRVYLVVEQDCGSTIVGCHQNYGGTYLSVTRTSGLN